MVSKAAPSSAAPAQPARSGVAPSKAAARRRRETGTAYALLAPSLFGITTFLVLPILVVVWLSLNRWDLISPVRFVGLDNVRQVLSDGQFARSMLITARRNREGHSRVELAHAYRSRPINPSQEESWTVPRSTA